MVVGHSANNAGRFGPCPYPNGIFDDKPPDLGSKAGGKLGCIEQTPIPLTRASAEATSSSAAAATPIPSSS